ncbi:MAG: response regulator transcription factor [Sedimentisphaerales bacterium]|nr:response regulator transcription factor [Sedimentisphaerales bacterium]
METPDAIVYVVDDEQAILDGLTMLLRTAGLSLKTFTSAELFLEEYTSAHPGCLLVDVRMPGMSGLQLQKELAQRHIDLPVIFMTGHGDIAMAVQAMRAGAFDFIEKPFRDDVLLDRLSRALEIGTEKWRNQRIREDFLKRLEELTPREREIMDLVAQGNLNRIVGEQLGISEKTVKNHRAAVMEKLEVNSLAELVRNLILVGQD